jgi:catalase
MMPASCLAGPEARFIAGASLLAPGRSCPAGTTTNINAERKVMETLTRKQRSRAEAGAGVATATGKDLAQQIFDLMVRARGNQPGHRPAHAKGLVCQGTFGPSKVAATLSKAAHFQGAVPVTVRFSDGGPDPSIPDNSSDASPRGMAIRFHLPRGGITDIVAISHNGFIVGTGEEFLALQQAIAATDPSQPHPWPIETFLATHPRARKFVQDNRVIPASFATEAFFSNDSFIFVNRDEVRQAGRYQMVPVAGRQALSDEEAKTRPANFLVQDLQTRLASGPVKFRLLAQLPDVGDPTNDPSLVWPDDRKTVDAGMISITSVVADSAGAERELVYDPTHLTEGIELSDDPLPALRARVYSLSASYRQQSQRPPAANAKASMSGEEPMQHLTRAATDGAIQNRREQAADARSNPTDRPDLRAQIELRAHHLWQADGGRHGNALNHWLQAEREIMNYTRTRKP